VRVVQAAAHRATDETAAAVAELSRRAEALLRPHVAAGEACALLDFPNHGNVGDSAIWLGTRALLARLGARVAYASDCLTLRADTLRACVGDGPIFLQGGGNLGDLWPAFQRFREEVVEAFPDRRVVILPQAIHFQDAGHLERARRVFGAHPRLTLMVRDRQSLEIARAQLSLDAVLCPDLAFGLGPLRRAGAPVHDVLLLARRDQEAAAERAARQAHAADVRVADWSSDDWMVGTVRFLTRRALRPRLLGRQWRHVTPVYDAFARARLRAGVRLLSRARVVVTDRLHGHVLCVLLGIPHVALDNSYGKVRSLLDTWTGGLPVVSRAESAERAVALARSLAGSA
jgi:exopolysaccharide biosynthesis predicted pyruvyltransferase EpsI